MVWKFVEEHNGRVVPNTNEGTGLICDAFVAVVQQPPPGRMTALADVGETKSPFKRQPREEVRRAVRFTKQDAVATAAFAATQVTPIYERVAPSDDRLRRAIQAAQGGKVEVLMAALDSVALAGGEARQAGQKAPALAAEAARSAAVASLSQDAGAALQATGYSVAYAIQAADDIGSYDEVVMAIEKWLLTQVGRLKEVKR